MKYKVANVSLGCSKNLVDSEILLGILNEKEYEIINEINEADIIIINTCGFINDAKEESINTILELSEYKKEGNCKALIVAGCLAERYKEELIKEMPEIDGIIGTGNLQDIEEVIFNCLKGENILKVGNIDSEYIENSSRVLTESSYMAYLKIAEGCNNFCTYCIIPKVRGRYRSRNMDSIIAEAKKLAQAGVKELILIAQDTSKYGYDLYKEYKLPELLDRLNDIEELKWIRILYLYPDNLTDEIISSIKRNNKIVNYVDIPIQHINDNVLKRMNRKTTKSEIVKLINKLRKEINNITIRTTLIVGFPGETEEEFNELYDFVKETKFDKLGVFTYSREEDTPAYKMPNQIDEDIKEQRQKKIMELQRQISTEKTSDKVGKIYNVIIDEVIPNENIYIGRTYMDGPEIDGVVYVTSDKSLNIGDFIKVKITEHLDYDLKGEVVYELS
ncbi:MAG: 30S ribosomal protein S12 methylthiotransferase RimO [Firmicutes bacterium]|nr:30S ribosomal protein S12 methylthiotransferase RimO [Bacillota bacterium]